MIRDPALVVVDLQKDFCRATSSSKVDQAEFDAMLKRTATFIERYRETGRTPIFVRTTHDEHSNSDVWAKKYEGRDNDMPCRTGTEGAEFVDVLPVEPSDIVVTKHRYSGFCGTDLETYLSSNDVNHLLIGGVNTNICIASTAFDAFNRDYSVTVLEDCTLASDPEQHQIMLENIGSNIGEIRRSDEIEL